MSLFDISERAQQLQTELLDVLAAVDEERFLILPHATVLDMFRQKATDYERWLRGMRRYQASLLHDIQ